MGGDPRARRPAVEEPIADAGRGALAAEPIFASPADPALDLTHPSIRALGPRSAVVSSGHDTIKPNDGDPQSGDPSAAATVTIVVCETCRDALGSESGIRPGALLAEATRRAAQGSKIRVRRVACLGNCKQRLSAALLRDGSWSYVFGGLDIDSGPDLVEGAKLFATSTDGILPWRGRPQSLKRGMVARLPPLDLLKESS